MGPLCGENAGVDAKAPTFALVAQRIRASDYGSEGREFESLQARFNRLSSFILNQQHSQSSAQLIGFWATGQWVSGL